MPEQSLSPRPKGRLSRRRLALMAGGAVLLMVGGLWLARKPLVSGVLQDNCRRQGLACEFEMSRLDFGGVTLRDLALKATDGEVAVISARRLAVDLNWASPFSARADWVGGDGITVKLDATGQGPLLGDLQAVLDNMPERDPDASPAPMPRISLRDIEVITETTLGPVRAGGQVLTGDGGVLDLRLSADPVSLSRDGAELRLNAAELRAKSDGKDLTGTLTLDLPAFVAEGSNLRDLKLDLSLAHDAAILSNPPTAGGAGDARPVSGGSGGATAELQAGPLTLRSLPAPEWLRGLKRLTITGAAGQGELAGARWAGGEITADISALDPGRSGGALRVVAREVQAAMGAAERFELDGQVALPMGGATAEGRTLTAEGTAKLSGAKLDAETRTAVGSAVSDPLQGALPNFARALAGSVMRAGEDFDVLLPWSFKMDDGGFDASARSGVVLAAGSGLSARLDKDPGAAVFQWESREVASWSASGALALSGGGAPPVTLALDQASGSAAAMQASASGAIGPWRVGRDVLSAEITRAELNTGKDGGRAEAAATVAFVGALGGVDWTNGRADGEVSAEWSPTSFRAEADKGLVVSWDKLTTAGTSLGAGALRYAPTGLLAERRGLGIGGAGTIAAIEAPLSGAAFTGRFASSPLKVDWTMGRAITGRVSGGPIAVDIEEQTHVTPIRVGAFNGAVRLDRTWSLSGAFSEGSVLGLTAAADGAGGKFRLSGGRRGVDGEIEQVKVRIYDPLEEANKRFEPVRFEGGAKINAGVADFSGELKLGATGMVLMAMTGKHDLGTGDGGANFAGKLRFSPAFFQPSRLSPLFRGPANVTGGLSLGGTATWNGETATASGVAQLDNLGFALANAGIFEGVSGRVEVADLFNLKSEPGQTITLKKVTLGAPIENGEIKFQLAGYEGIKLESARWPFAGGELRVRPSDVAFAMEGTHVVAEAVNWDLQRVIEIFKVPDVKARGRVNGRFPITFTTGSARIDKAILLASEEGGVLQYTGDTGEAAGRADQNARMLFDALKDFRFKVLELELDGDLAGDMDLKLKLQGNNPQVLSGGEFHINIGIDAPLMSLLNMQNNVNSTVQSIIDEISGGVR